MAVTFDGPHPRHAARALRISLDPEPSPVRELQIAMPADSQGLAHGLAQGLAQGFDPADDPFGGVAPSLSTARPHTDLESLEFLSGGLPRIVQGKR